MRTILYIFLILFCSVASSCVERPISKTTKSKSEEAKSIQRNDSLSDEQRLENILKGLEYSFQTTNYCALIKQENFSTNSLDEDVDVIRINAEVLEIFMGTSDRSIVYEMDVEKGERTELAAEPIVICLCNVGDIFYWPGVGSIFPNELFVLDSARVWAKKYNSIKKDNCLEY